MTLVALILLSVLSFFAGMLAMHMVHELAPYVVFWYNMRKQQVPAPKAKVARQETLRDLQEYNQLTLRKRFVLEKDKRLN